MENYRLIKYFAIVLGGMLFLGIPFFLLAYSDKTTHPALTDKIIDHFNRFYTGRALSVSQKELVKLGSTEEDEETRWLQHFYDPIYNRGLMTLGKEWENAKSWSQNTLAQASEDGIWKDSTYGSIFSLFSSDSDFSWERAIYEYAWGDKNRAILALGHVLHLLEDASVPDHTRNDPHPHITELFSITNASPYEVWTKKFTPDNLTLRTNEPPIILGSLNDYFDSMAGRSELIFVYGNETNLSMIAYSNVTTGRISLEIGETNTFVDIQGKAKQKSSLILQILPEFDNYVLVNVTDRQYKFVLNKGQNFFFVITKQIGEEKYVANK